MADISKNGVRLHKSNFLAVGQQLLPLLESGDCYRLILRPWKEKRSLSQNSLVHMWFGEISEYLIKSGRIDATPDWVKRNLKRTYLGCEEITYTDFVTGEKVTSYEHAIHPALIQEICTSSSIRLSSGARSSGWR